MELCPQRQQQNKDGPEVEVNCQIYVISEFLYVDAIK